MTSGAAYIYVVAIWAHEDPAAPGRRYTFTSWPGKTLGLMQVASPCPCEGYPIGFEWYMVPPEFEKTIPVLVKSCGDTSRIYPFIFSDGFELGDTSRWSTPSGP